MRIQPGAPYPLGATFDGAGTNFSIFSEAAERVELCLFGEDGAETRVELPEVTAFCWHAAFFDIIQQDPVISQVKLIAEPWDVGEGGYQVGNFPPLWSEWNGKYRDTVRDYWRGENRTLGELANRLTGSSDLYATTGRRPYVSINFVTAHDGFTLRDLVSYNEKHNEANGPGAAGRQGAAAGRLESGTEPERPCSRRDC